MSETKSAGVPAGATHVCTVEGCGVYYRHYYRQIYYRQISVCETMPRTSPPIQPCLHPYAALAPIAKAGPVPTTAAPAEPTQEQIEKARVWWDKHKRGPLMSAEIVTRFAAAEAAPLREERDKLARELADAKKALAVACRAGKQDFEGRDAAEKEVAERDARIEKLEKAFRSALDFMDTAVTWLNSSAEIIEDDHKEDAEEVEECREVAKEMHDFILLHRAALGASE